MTQRRKSKPVVFTLIAIAIIAIGAYHFYWRPHNVNKSSQLTRYDGRNVRLTATFDGDDKGYDLLYFDDVKIPVRHTPGSFSWPATGDTVTVVGTLQRHPNPDIGSKFVIVNATWKIDRPAPSPKPEGG